jgi:predicted transglutaminase-like cysteine proteinase
MRRTKIAAAIALVASVGWSSGSEAAFSSFPQAPKLELDRINFQEPTLAPMAHTMFCLRYREDCEVHKVDFRKRNVAVNLERLDELNAVNRRVNRDIVPQINLGGLATERWLISPAAGDCNDYAVTKRHELLAHGWPSRALLLSEVVIPSGEHHLVLVAHMKDADTGKEVDLVLDNLNYGLRPVGLTRYRWLRMESPRNPKYWSTISIEPRLRTAALAD